MADRARLNDEEPARKTVRYDFKPFPPATEPGRRVNLRVSEHCIVRFNGVAGIRETVEHDEPGREPTTERLGEVSEPLS
jgi:hypothetical protein